MTKITEKALSRAPDGRFDGTYRIAAGAPQSSYFAAVNSGSGFVSYFDGLIRDRCDRRMIIKGGPGTGKSRMLYEAAKIAADADAAVEYYFCSSDPDSLDGITAVFPDGVLMGIQDGTAPHAAEASLPGARDGLFDLGAFWRADTLSSARREIEELNGKKSRAWRDAFECLAAARGLRKTALTLAGSIMDPERMCRAAARAAGEARRRAELPQAVSGLSPEPLRGSRVLYSPHRSLGMKGAVSLGGIYEGADDVYLLSDELLPGTGMLFITELADCVARTGTAARISPDPVAPEFCAAVRIGSCVFTADRRLPDGAEATVHRIGMRRFADAGGLHCVRGEYMRLISLSDAVISAALTAMARASDAHFALEDIYMSAMDFDAKENASHAALEEFFAQYL